MCCAGNELDGEIIAMAPQWISKTAHGRALEEGFRVQNCPTVFADATSDNSVTFRSCL